MIFKERLNRGTTPEDEKIKVPASRQAGIEAEIADFLGSLSSLDVSQVSIVYSDGTAVLSGYVADDREISMIEDSIVQNFPGLPIDNRLRAG